MNRPIKMKQYLWGPYPTIVLRSKYVYVLSHVWLFATPWTVAHQAPLSVGFSRQEQFAIPFSRGSSQPRDQTWVSCISCIGRQSSLPLQNLRSKWGNRNELGKLSRWWGVDVDEHSGMSCEAVVPAPSMWTCLEGSVALQSQMEDATLVLRFNS